MMLPDFRPALQRLGPITRNLSGPGIFGPRPGVRWEPLDGLGQQFLGFGDTYGVAQSHGAGAIADVVPRHRLADFPPALHGIVEIAAPIGDPAALDGEPWV